ncbi:MAG TPA: dihydropteroate synthase [Campylobacterales bacterium]|nr:dihydropteroate synthase [Campylobacterales bacterium]
MFIRDITELEKNSIEILKKVDVDRGAYSILGQKMKTYLLYISDVNIYGANILKQDALSVGADFAVPKNAIRCESEKVDGVLIATYKQLQILSKKELAQPYGLKEIAKELKKFLKAFKYQEFQPKIMGVLNINQDSFFPNSRTNIPQLLERAEEMIGDGADILDIGAVSSRPFSKSIPEEEELERVRPAIDILFRHGIHEKVELSIDSYSPKVIDYALSNGFNIVNDITGLLNDEVAKIVAKHNAKVVIMHMQGTPETMQIDPKYSDVTKEVYYFFQERIEKAKRFGIDEANIILDIGIGFGKTLQHNIELLQSLKTFATFGRPLLVGVSRKSMIDKIFPTPVEERLPGTLALHQKALENGASILRVHDVKEHKQMVEIWKAFYKV